MKRISVVTIVIVLIVAAGTPAIVAAEDDVGIADALNALVQVTTRLAESLERQGREYESDRDLRRTAIAVQILDIRTRRQEDLRRELLALDDREQQVLGQIASNEVRMESVDLQMAQATDEAKKLELQVRRVENEAYMKHNQAQLEYVRRRRTEIDGLLDQGRRMTRDIEDLVENWLLEPQTVPPAR